jgi:hypothetical protein
MLENEKAIAGANIKNLTQFITLSGIASILPFFIHLQWITGPIVNAILILALLLIGIRSALLLCVIPSLMALSGGLLPFVLAPVIPFIAIGNVIFVLTIYYFYYNFNNEKKGYWFGVIFGAVLKFVFLYLSVNLISNILIKQELILKVAQMMSWPQFFTAMTGGMIAWGILKWLKRL